jgi:hypothetical protein
MRKISTTRKYQMIRRTANEDKERSKQHKNKKMAENPT